MNPINRDGNKFCGPLVLAGILGCSAGHAAELVARNRVANKGVRLQRTDGTTKLKRVRARTGVAVRGTYEGELFAVLQAHGFRLEPVDVGARYGRVYTGWVNDNVTRTRSFAPDPWSNQIWHPWTYLKQSFRQLRSLRTLFNRGTFIVNTPGHWALARDGHWCETFTNGQFVPLTLAPQARRKVLRAWRVLKEAA